MLFTGIAPPRVRHITSSPPGPVCRRHRTGPAGGVPRCQADRSRDRWHRPAQRVASLVEKQELCAYDQACRYSVRWVSKIRAPAWPVGRAAPGSGSLCCGPVRAGLRLGKPAPSIAWGWSPFGSTFWRSKRWKKAKTASMCRAMDQWAYQDTTEWRNLHTRSFFGDGTAHGTLSEWLRAHAILAPLPMGHWRSVRISWTSARTPR